MTGEHVSADISGLIGQYAHGNEPSHNIAYLYAWAGPPRPHRRPRAPDPGHAVPRRARRALGQRGLRADVGVVRAQRPGLLSRRPVIGRVRAGRAPLRRGPHPRAARHVHRAGHRDGPDARYVRSVRLNGRPVAVHVHPPRGRGPGRLLEIELGPTPDPTVGHEAGSGRPRTPIPEVVVVRARGGWPAMKRGAAPARGVAARASPAGGRGVRRRRRRAPPPALTTRRPRRGWQLRAAPTPTWIPATVPGTVHTDLLAAGLIPDPFAGTASGAAGSRTPTGPTGPTSTPTRGCSPRSCGARLRRPGHVCRRAREREHRAHRGQHVPALARGREGRAARRRQHPRGALRLADPGGRGAGGRQPLAHPPPGARRERNTGVHAEGRLPVRLGLGPALRDQRHLAPARLEAWSGARIRDVVASGRGSGTPRRSAPDVEVDSTEAGGGASTRGARRRSSPCAWACAAREGAFGPVLGGLPVPRPADTDRATVPLSRRPSAGGRGAWASRPGTSTDVADRRWQRRGDGIAHERDGRAARPITLDDRARLGAARASPSS